MKPSIRAALAAMMSMMPLAGCTESPAQSVKDALLGTWELSIVSETPMPESKPIRLQILLEEGWFFDAELTTNCGLDGLLGDWSGDWREVEVTLGRSPSKGPVSGSLQTNCIMSVQPMSGYLIEAFFGDGQMVGKISHQVNRGSKSGGAIFLATQVLLFVGRKRMPG